MAAWRLFDALFGRNTTPIEGILEAVHRRWDAVGPLTAFEAYDLVERLARWHDADAVPVAIESRGGVEPDGRAARWIIALRLPVRRGLATYDVMTRVDERDWPIDGVDIDERVEPHSVERATRSPIPVPFTDSPAAVRDLFSAAPPPHIDLRLVACDSPVATPGWQAINRRDEPATARAA